MSAAVVWRSQEVMLPLPIVALVAEDDELALLVLVDVGEGVPSPLPVLSGLLILQNEWLAGPPPVISL